MNFRLLRYALWALIAVLCGFLVFTYINARNGGNAQAVQLGVPFNLVDQNGAPISGQQLSRAIRRLCSSVSPIAPRYARQPSSKWPDG